MIRKISTILLFFLYINSFADYNIGIDIRPQVEITYHEKDKKFRPFFSISLTAFPIPITVSYYSNHRKNILFWLSIMGNRYSSISFIATGIGYDDPYKLFFRIFSVFDLPRSPAFYYSYHDKSKVHSLGVSFVLKTVGESMWSLDWYYGKPTQDFSLKLQENLTKDVTFPNSL